MVAGYFEFEEGTVPSTPTTAKWRLYFKTDGLYVVDDAGTETNIAVPSALDISSLKTDQLFLDAGSELTIATGAITVTNARHTVDTESDAGSDDLVTISGTSAGELFILSAIHTDRSIVLKNGSGNIICATGADITLEETYQAVLCISDGTNVTAYTLFGSGSGGSATPNFGAEATKTISSGVVATGTDRNLIIAAESSTADDLVEITGLTVGDKVLLRADTGDTITVKHNSGSATIKILIQDNADFVLDEDHPLELVLLSTNKLSQIYDEAGSSGGSGNMITALDVKTSGTHGGASSAGTQTRVLNTLYNPDSVAGVSLSSNQLTLPAGTYKLWHYFGAVYRGNNSQLFIYDVTNTAVLQTDGSIDTAGVPSYTSSGNSIAITSIGIYAEFTLSDSTALELRHYISSAQASNGLGSAMGQGRDEIYAGIVLEKIA